MSPLRVGIIGGGHLGRIHAKLAKSNEQFLVVAVADPVAATRKLIETQLHIATESDYRSLVGRIDAAIVAAPTSLHYDIASTLLRAGIHTLVEKPLASSPDQAERLVQISHHHQRVLQVGHVERFNPSWTAIQPHLGIPKFIDATRAGSYSGRSTDIGVVMDLMIHDLDLVLSLVNSDLVEVSACGLALLGRHEDLAEARLLFENGCIASLKVSRVSLEPARRMQIYSTSGFAEIDFQKNEVRVVKPSANILDRSVQLDQLPDQQRIIEKDRVLKDYFHIETLSAQSRNAILDEQNDFALSIRSGVAPCVTGADGCLAVQVAARILKQIDQHLWNGTSSKPWQIGPQATLTPNILSIPNQPTSQAQRSDRKAA